MIERRFRREVPLRYAGVPVHEREDRSVWPMSANRDARRRQIAHENNSLWRVRCAVATLPDGSGIVLGRFTLRSASASNRHFHYVLHAAGFSCLPAFGDFRFCTIGKGDRPAVGN
jgi:hypothetical protein